MLWTSLLSTLTCLIIAACLEWVTVPTVNASGAYALHTCTATIGLLSADVDISPSKATTCERYDFYGNYMCVRYDLCETFSYLASCLPLLQISCS